MAEEELVQQALVWYVAMRKISVRLAPVYLWLSLHDTTPNVKGTKKSRLLPQFISLYRWKMKKKSCLLRG